MKPEEKPEPTFDQNGYPTDETCQKIEAWSYDDIAGCLDFIEKAWHSNGQVIRL